MPEEKGVFFGYFAIFAGKRIDKTLCMKYIYLQECLSIKKGFGAKCLGTYISPAEVS